jgi:predicted RNA-binding Zn ribbon-like protein
MTSADPPPQWSAADLAFRFDSGWLCLDFAATVGDRAHHGFERLRQPDDLAVWLVDAGLSSRSTLVDDTDLDQARILREAIYRVVSARHQAAAPPEQDIKLINNWATRAPMAPQLDTSGTALNWISDRPFEAAMASLARDAARLCVSPELQRIRECEEATCSVLFVDTSRPGNRRWCSMQRCGNRAKKAAWRDRQTASD